MGGGGRVAGRAKNSSNGGKESGELMREEENPWAWFKSPDKTGENIPGPSAQRHGYFAIVRRCKTPLPLATSPLETSISSRRRRMRKIEDDKFQAERHSASWIRLQENHARVQEDIPTSPTRRNPTTNFLRSGRTARCCACPSYAAHLT